ncbi:MAG TPA: hypothetical protein VHN11_15775, partial [Xanthobacteraceae bacterium]|nr:hypothetical protein [Xanthobacteraceae bacterium]
MSGFGRHSLCVIAFSAAFIADAFAIENLDAGKTGAKLFERDCSSCHKTSRGLVKDGSSRSLNSFLLQHYTTGPASADEISKFLLSSGPAAPAAPADSKPARPRISIEDLFSPRSGTGEVHRRPPEQSE